MRKKLIVIISITLVVVSGVGATVGAIAGSNRSAVLIEGEKAFADQFVVKEDAEKTKTQIFYASNEKETGAEKNEKNVADDKVKRVEKELAYEKTWNLSEDKTLDIYKDPENRNVEYRYSGSELTGYKDDAAIQREIQEDVSITQQEAVTIARKHFMEIYGKNISAEDMKAERDEDGNYVIQYRQFFGVEKFIYGPRLNIKIAHDGSVLFSANSLGELKNMDKDMIAKINKIKKEDMDAFGLSKAQGTQMEHHEYLRYEPDIVTLEKNEEGDYYLNVFGTIEMQEKSGSRSILLLPVTYRYDFEW